MSNERIPVYEGVCPRCGKKYRSIGLIDPKLVHEYHTRGMTRGEVPPWEKDENIIRKK